MLLCRLWMLCRFWPESFCETPKLTILIPQTPPWIFKAMFRLVEDYKAHGLESEIRGTCLCKPKAKIEGMIVFGQARWANGWIMVSANCLMHSITCIHWKQCEKLSFALLAITRPLVGTSSLWWSLAPSSMPVSGLYLMPQLRISLLLHLCQSKALQFMRQVRVELVSVSKHWFHLIIKRRTSNRCTRATTEGPDAKKRCIEKSMETATGDSQGWGPNSSHKSGDIAGDKAWNMQSL